MSGNNSPGDRDRHDEREPRTDRRQYLGALGAAALGLGTLTTGSSGQPARPEDDFEIQRTFDVVEDLGADPTGNDPIGPVIEKYVRSNTRLVFPQGRYRIVSPISRFGEGIHDFAMVAPERNATLAFDAAGPYWLSVGGKDAYNLHYEGFTHDVRAQGAASRLQLRARDGLVVRDVTHEGTHSADIGPFRFDVQSPEGRGVIENLRAREGAPDDTLAVGMFVGTYHTGRLEIRNCSLHDFPNNGIYQANESAGVVIVEGGTYVNNNISNVRISGPGSVVRDATIVVDRNYATNDRLGTNVRGIRITNGTGMRVENCDITIAAAAPSDGAITVNRPAGTLTVSNTRITLDGDDVMGIRAKRPLAPGIDQHSVVCSGVRITGSATDTTADGDDRAGIEIVGRPFSQVRDACVSLTGPNRDGIKLDDCDGSAIRGSGVDVTGDAIVVADSDRVTVRGNRIGNASCPRADTGGVDVDPGPTAMETTTGGEQSGGSGGSNESDADGSDASDENASDGSDADGSDTPTVSNPADGSTPSNATDETPMDPSGNGTEPSG